MGNKRPGRKTGKVRSWLIDIRKEKDLTQGAVAAAVGISQPSWPPGGTATGNGTNIFYQVETPEGEIHKVCPCKHCPELVAAVAEPFQREQRAQRVKTDQDDSENIRAVLYY